MKVSVEISLYPLSDQYIKQIDDFIFRLKKAGKFEVQTNHFSTQIFGDYEEVMQALQQEMKQSFENGMAAFNLKVLPTDLREEIDITKFQ